jgi:hypothetical protein
MEELNLIIQDFEETCSTLSITHDSPCEETIKEKFEEYHQAKLKLLGIADVVVPNGTLCDGLCRVESTVNAKEQCIRCGEIHKE